MHGAGWQGDRTTQNCWHTNTSSRILHVCMNAHTRALSCTPHTRTPTHSFWGFGVQRMFYFWNSFGLVTLHWWQTEKQVANIKHFTSSATHAANTHTKNTRSHFFPCFLILSANSKKGLAKGRTCCFKACKLISPSPAANVWSQPFWQVCQKH